MHLLASTGIGGIAVAVPEWPEPTLRPVNYVFDESGRLDPDGCLKIAGRKKDLIITSTGQNITPAKYRERAARDALDLGGGRLRLRRITELRCGPQQWRGLAGRLTLLTCELAPERRTRLWT
jgi:hypothetical protein